MLLGRKAMRNLDSVLKSRNITLPTRVHIVKAMAFPVVVYGCESWTIKKSWVPKNWCVQIVLEKALESPLDCKEIKPVNPRGNQLWIFIGRIDAEAEAPILWPPDGKSQLTGKDPDAEKDWRQKEKGAVEVEMIRSNHWLNGQEFEQTPGDGEGKGSLLCCNPWSRRVGLSNWTTIKAVIYKM